MSGTITDQERRAPDSRGVTVGRRKSPLGGRYRTIANVVAAFVGPAVYFLYVARYAVDVPEEDEWLRIRFLDHAIHGHLTLGALWAPYDEERILIGNLIYVVSAFADRFDIRALILFNAGIFICTFWIFLAIFRAYRGGQIGVLSILVISVVWFSLANVENSLDGTQAPFLVLLFLIIMTYSLTVPRRHRSFFLALAAFSAIAASCTAIQGFVLWPVGLICLLWTDPRARRTFAESGSWILAGVITVALYSIGFNHSTGCPNKFQNECSLNYAAHHPEAAIRFLLVLVGNVIPSGYLGALFTHPTHFGTQELVGALILLVAAGVVAQSIRQRGSLASPLPVLLITFGVCYDAIIAQGRAGLGLVGAVNGNRYVLPNLLVLLGIAVFALGYVPAFKAALGHDAGRSVTARSGWWRLWVGSALAGVTVFLIVQVAVATPFGIHNGALTREVSTKDARILANLDRYPRTEWGCALDLAMFNELYVSTSRALKTGVPIFLDARADHFSFFQPGQYHLYRLGGPPSLRGTCTATGGA